MLQEITGTFHQRIGLGTKINNILLYKNYHAAEKIWQTYKQHVMRIIFYLTKTITLKKITG